MAEAIEALHRRWLLQDVANVLPPELDDVLAGTRGGRTSEQDSTRCALTGSGA
jgi:hypothetical protein